MTYTDEALLEIGAATVHALEQLHDDYAARRHGGVAQDRMIRTIQLTIDNLGPDSKQRPRNPAHVDEALAQLDELEARLAELTHPSILFGNASSLRDLGALHLRSIRRLLTTYSATSMPPPPPSAPPAEDFEIPPFRPPTLPIGLALLQAEDEADALTIDEIFPHTDTDPTPPHGIPRRLPTLAEVLHRDIETGHVLRPLPFAAETFDELRRRTLGQGFGTTT